MGSNNDKGINSKHLSNWSKSFTNNPKNLLASNSTIHVDYQKLSVSRHSYNKVNHTYSHTIEQEGNITDQKASGRCWMFAALNVMRLSVMKKYKLDKFELSQSYLFFWDKLEKSNYFLESIIESRAEDIMGQEVVWLFDNLQSDGGQWHMFTNLVKKYGVVPKDAMQETFSSSHSNSMNYFLKLKLREYGLELRNLHKLGKKENYIRKRKVDMMANIYRILCICFGEPPKRFDWQFKDRNNNFKRFENLTAQTFLKKHVPFNIKDYICMIHDPSPLKKYNELYTLQHLGNIKEGEIIKYINLPIEQLKKCSMNSLKAGEAVWFGCDFVHQLHRELGVLDEKFYDYQLVFDTGIQMNKSDRLLSRESCMHHAMVFTGVDVKNNQPTKWRVENSHGDKNGDKGYLMMTDNWFAEYVYEVVVHKKFVSDKIQNILKKEVNILPPWDPMGALAIKN